MSRTDASSAKSAEMTTVQIREKKEAAIHEVGKRYGRAITRLSDT